jgi:DUF917 family protein
MILKTAETDQRAERIAREMAVLSGGAVGVARCPAKWLEYKKAVIPNTMSKSKNLGAALRNARDKGKNPIDAITSSINGQVLFEGKVEICDVFDEGGFVVGHILITNDKEYDYELLIKNEYIVSMFNGKPHLTTPDLICAVDAETGEGLTPWADDFTKNRSVVVIGAKNAPIWYTEKGLEIFGPRHFGFDFDNRSFILDDRD